MQEIQDESFGDATVNCLCRICGGRIDGGNLQGMLYFV